FDSPFFPITRKSPLQVVTSGWCARLHASRARLAALSSVCASLIFAMIAGFSLVVAPSSSAWSACISSLLTSTLSSSSWHGSDISPPFLELHSRWKRWTEHHSPDSHHEQSSSLKITVCAAH